MDDIKKNKSILPSYIYTPGTMVDTITCRKLKRLQFNINLINKLKTEVSSTKKFFAFDTEAFEDEQDKLTEFGWSIFNNNGEIFEESHFIVDENYDLRNHKYVPDYKDYYLFGKSERLPLLKIEEILKEKIKTIDFIIGQGIDNDINYLKDLGIDIKKFVCIDGEDFDPNGKAVIETSDLYAAYYLEKPSSLEKGLIKCKIPHEKMHNAGNDAHYTMEYVLYFINGLDINEEKYQKLLNIKVPSHIKSYKYNKFKNIYDDNDDYNYISDDYNNISDDYNNISDDYNHISDDYNYISDDYSSNGSFNPASLDTYNYISDDDE